MTAAVEKHRERSSRRRSSVIAVTAITLLAMAPAEMRAEMGSAGVEEGMPKGGPVDVKDRSTRSLATACLAEQGSPSSWCSAYLIGVADTLTAFGQGGNKNGICADDYSIEQLPEIFLTWTRANAALLGIDMLAGASLAFRRKWPCA